VRLIKKAEGISPLRRDNTQTLSSITILSGDLFIFYKNETITIRKTNQLNITDWF
jgi:hypothetical protein